MQNKELTHIVNVTGGIMAYESIILAAAKAAKVSGSLLLAICMHETKLENVLIPYDGGSPTIGICGLKHETAKMMGYTWEPVGLMNPEVNAKWAAEYLKYQMNRYDQNLCKAVSAYNAGKYTESTTSPGNPKNLKYVNKVKRNLHLSLQHTLNCANISK